MDPVIGIFLVCGVFLSGMFAGASIERRNNNRRFGIYKRAAMAGRIRRQFNG